MSRPSFTALRILSPVASLLCLSLLSSCSKKTQLEVTSSMLETTPEAGIARVNIGANRMDLSMAYLGTTSNGSAQPKFRKVTRAMARKSIYDARNLGFTFFRVAAAHYGPIAHASDDDLGIWRDRPAEFWAATDLMMNDLQAAGVGIVPSFVWNRSQFPALTKTETIRDLITNPNSASYGLLQRFVREWITRYRDRPNLRFYELTNELNLTADLNMAHRCRVDHPLTGEPGEFDWCDAEGNFSTDEMIAFTNRLAFLVRSLDPVRKITSGYGTPGWSAEHLRRKPEFPGPPDFTQDSKAQFQKNLIDIHAGMEIVSIHPYGGGTDLKRFSLTELKFIELIKSTADSAGKQLFIGEYNADPHFLAGSARDNWLRTFAQEILQIGVPFSAVWNFEFYQTAPYRRDEGYSLDPGFNDVALGILRDTSRTAGTFADPVGADTVAPAVVLTWPLESATLETPKQLIAAVAADDRGAVARVEFFLDGDPIGTSTRAPYQVEIDTGSLSSGPHLFTVRAFDPAGNVAESRTSAVAPGGNGLPGFPKVTVVNAANYRGGAAPGSLATIKGGGLAGDTRAASTNPLPIMLLGVEVLIDGDPVPLLYVSPTQINFSVPDETWLGDHDLLVRRDGHIVATSVFHVTITLPGLFTGDASGTGYPVGQEVTGTTSASLIKPDGSPYVLTIDPAVTQALVLYGTGWRGVRTLDQVRAELGGVPLTVLFVGAQSQYVGLDQINLLLAPEVAALAGRDADLVLRVDGHEVTRLPLRIH